MRRYESLHRNSASVWRSVYVLLFGMLALWQAAGIAWSQDPCRHCVTILESRIACPTDPSGILNWELVVRNDSDFEISWLFFLQGPSGVQVSPNPYQFTPPLRPGEIRKITLQIGGQYLGYNQLCFDMVFYNASLDRCCRVQHCVNTPRCCFIIREEQVVCDPHTGEFVYTFTIFNQFPAIVQYVVVLSDTPGVTVVPQVTVLSPPISYLGTAQVTVRIRGATPGQTVRLRIGLLDFLGGFCCSITHEVTMPPCCFEIVESSVECTEEGTFYNFTLKNWYPASICWVVLIPTTQGVSVTPNQIAVIPPLAFGESRSFRVRVDGPRCGGQVCLQILLLDCLFRQCCSNQICFEAGRSVVSRTWTTTEDFESGTVDNLDTSNDELKLPREITFEYPYVWLANFNSGTVSKVKVERVGNGYTVKEVARYYGPGGLVSRTAVDRFGNVWVEARGSNAVFQILEESNWTPVYDFNGNGVLDTSRDLNGDGCIQPNEMLPWGRDELVVRYYRFDRNTHNFPRALAIDLNGMLWVGFFSSRRIVQIDPNLPGFAPPAGGTPPFLEDLQVSFSPYGFAVSPNGYIYALYPFAEFCPGDPAIPNDAVVTRVSSQYSAYGIAVGPDCRVWGASPDLILWDPVNDTAQIGTPPPGLTIRNVIVGLDGRLWTSTWGGGGGIIEWNPNTLTPTSHPTCYASVGAGIGISLDGLVAATGWVVQTALSFHDPTTGAIVGCVTCEGMEPYNYNDFTGAQLRYALQEGRWSTVYDGGCEDTLWGDIRWNASVPQGTSIGVRVRTSNDQNTWSDWREVRNGQEFCLRGRYIQVEVFLSRTPETVTCNRERCGNQGELPTPVLYDLTVSSRCQCPPGGLVHGRVFADSDRDGSLDPGERTLDGWRIVIEDGSGRWLSQITNGEGEYRFENLPPGEYRVVQITPPGWAPIRPPQGEEQVSIDTQSSARVDFANAMMGDVNGDFCVDDTDLLSVLTAFGTSGENIPEDLNRDGTVDDSDLLLILLHFGLGC